MTDLLWVGGTTGNWFDPSNWQPPQVPQKGDIARVISLNNSTIVQLSSDPADGVTLEMSEFPHEVQPLLEAQNVTFGPHFTIVGDTAPLDPTPVIAVTGSVVNQGSINSGLEIDGRTGADVFVNQGTLNGPITLGPTPTSPILLYGSLVPISSFLNSGQINGAFSDSATDITGTGSVNISLGATVVTTAAVGSGQAFNFSGPNAGSLTLDPTKFSATISGFAAGSSISSDRPIDSETYDPANHVLSLFSSGQPAGSLNIAGPLSYTTQSHELAASDIGV